MSDIELKPCPFCGEEAKIIVVPGPGSLPSVIYIRCGKKCCVTKGYGLQLDAIEAWNRRVTE